jgi:hypothetical protein
VSDKKSCDFLDAALERLYEDMLKLAAACAHYGDPGYVGPLLSAYTAAVDENMDVIADEMWDDAASKYPASFQSG